MTDSTWKKPLLKSGLPLEHVVTTELSKKDFWVSGEFPYIRGNEQGIDTEFSVDTHAFQIFNPGEEDSWGVLEVLAECKYRNPGCTWVFAPYPEVDAVPVGVIYESQELSAVRVDTHPLYDFEQQIPYCVNGVELMGNEARPQSIRRALYQLRYATPSLLYHTMLRSLDIIDHEWAQIRFYCPILVTTAELRLLDRHDDLEAIQKASSLDEIAKEVDSLIVNQGLGPQLHDFTQGLFGKLLEKHPKIPRRLDALAAILTGPTWETRIPPDLDSLSRSYAGAAERVLVVRHSAFGSTLDEIVRAVKSTGASRITFGRYEKSRDGTVNLVSADGETLAEDI